MQGYIINSIGFVGVAFGIIAFFLLENDNIKSNSLTYIILNLISSFCILTSLYHAWNLPVFIINTIWIGISFYGVYQLKKEKRNYLLLIKEKINPAPKKSIIIGKNQSKKVEKSNGGFSKTSFPYFDNK